MNMEKSSRPKAHRHHILSVPDVRSSHPSPAYLLLATPWRHVPFTPLAIYGNLSPRTISRLTTS